MGACEEDSAKHAPHKPEAVEVLLASYQKQLADLTAKVSQLETRLELREKQPRRSDSMISQDSAGRATSPSLGMLAQVKLNVEQLVVVQQSWSGHRSNKL